MKRLSQTWRQKAKSTESTTKIQNKEYSRSNARNVIASQGKAPRRSLRLANFGSFKDDTEEVLQDITAQYTKSSSTNINKVKDNSAPSVQCSLLNSSLGFEFDSQTLSAVNKVEEEHKRGNLKHLPFLECQSPVNSDAQKIPILTSKTEDIQNTGNGISNDQSRALSVCKLIAYDHEKPDIIEQDRITLNAEIIDIKTSNNGECVLSGKETLSHHNSNLENSSHDTQEQYQLSSWGLPDNILEQYKKIGITTMFEWQAHCLCTGNVLNGGNLVYSAPTSAGKTMVAEILMLKRILETKCKAMFILPFVSVAREKMFYLQRMFGEAGIKVDGYMGSQVPSKGFDSVDIAVCTIEKANGLVNRLMESGQLHNVGVIIVDEMHLIGDTSRGYLLELLLTKVLYTTEKTTDSLEKNVQIIGMSATLPNLNVLATWLRADLYFTDYRPVPLTETFKVGPIIYDKSGNILRDLKQARMVSGDDDHVLALCQETVEEGNGVLVFCPTKSWCEKLAESIAKHFYTQCSGKTERSAEDDPRSVIFDYNALREVFEQLRSCQVGLDNVLGRILRYGVAYHHAGLTYDERDIIEAGFRQGIIKVLVATSTLSSGVNLPARRVIIRTPLFHGKLLDALVYKQMSGRAGRKGVDSQGESILICKKNEKQKAQGLIKDDLKPVESCLVVKRSDEDEGNGIKRALLEIIASGVASTSADVKRYASCTFYVSSKAQEDSENTQNIINNTVRYLKKNEFITLRKNDENESYVPTQLGQATLASSLSPDEALVVFSDLRKARKCFVLENELHILYQVTPIYVQDQWPNLDWYQYLRLYERLSSHMKNVAHLVGIEERFLNRAIRNQPPTRSEAQRHTLRVHKRFYVTLALHDLVHEMPLDTVARKYGANRGMLQSLQGSAGTFAGMVTIFCRKLGWNNLDMLLSQFQNRLTFGIERELCDLVRISALNAFRARVLYSSGYHTVASLAIASSVEVEKHLRNATPFQSSKKSEGESDYELRRRMRAKCVWIEGGKALTEAEAAREIVKEACTLLKEDASKLGMTLKPETIVSSCEQDLKSTNKNDISQDNKVADSDDNGKKNSSIHVQVCRVSESSEKTSTPTSVTMSLQTTCLTTKSSLKDPNIQENGVEALSCRQNADRCSSATLRCNNEETTQVSTTVSNVTCSDVNTTTSSCVVTTNPAVCNTSAVSLHNVENNIMKETVSETSNKARNIKLIRDETAKLVKGIETPRKKRNGTLKRKHSVSKSPKDCNGSKIKPFMDRRKSSGYSGKPLNNSKDSVINPKFPMRSNNKMKNDKDNFYADCLNNFKMKGSETPTKRKARCALILESSPDTNKNPSREISAMCTKTKYSKESEERNQASPSATSEFLNEITTNTSSDLAKKDFEEVAENDCLSAGNLFESTSEFETPMGKQFEIEDESPELITTGESNDSPSRIPFVAIENNIKTNPELLVTSPELYSEALFPDYESPENKNFDTQTQKICESSRHKNLNKITQDLVAPLNGEEDQTKEKESKSKLPGETVHTPCRDDVHSNETSGGDIASVVAMCTPGMFDSDMQLSMNNSRLFECVSTNQQTQEQYEQKTEERMRNSQQFNVDSKELEKSPEQFKTSPEMLRRSSDSFSLRLSQSFECASDSDLSSRTLAAVAALEEQEMTSKHNEENQDKDNQDKEGDQMGTEDSAGSQGFQELSNISLLTLAAIEAMDEELRQNPACNFEQGKDKHQSHIVQESSPVNEKHFTEIKQRNLPIDGGVTTKLEYQKSPRSHTRSDRKFDRQEHFRLTMSSHPGSTSPFEIIDVAKNRKAFEMFVEGSVSNSFSFSVAMEKQQVCGSTIGRKFNKAPRRSTVEKKCRLAIEVENVTVVGVAVCWEKRRVYFLSLQDEKSEQYEVPWEERMDILQSIMVRQANDHVKIAFGMKEQYKILSRACGIVLKAKLQDPKIASWLLDPGAKEKNFLQMVEHFLPQHSSLLEGIIGSCGHAGVGQATQSSIPARKRSCLDAALSRMLIHHIRSMLEADELWDAFTRIEMPAISCLARMELNGFGFSDKECEEIKHVLGAKLRALEKEAYGLAKRSFCLTSPEEVSRVLFLELKLPPDGNTDVSTTPGKAVRPTRGGKRRKLKYFSTSKDVLEKLTSLHPLPKLILEWRRVNSALTKIVYPVQKEQVSCDPPLSMSRIFPTALTHTATGRVTFVEPNLQNVPRDFDINLPTVISDTPPDDEHLLRDKRQRKKGMCVRVHSYQSSLPGPQFSVSLRSAFIPFSNGILLAADYSQLELRLIAHLSNDEKLTGYLNAGGDAFRMIASEIFHIAQDRISDEQRQRAKHVCYGIIYGIGAKALGETLGVDENEAGLFVDAFKSRFSGVRAYLKTTINECRRLGYVTTISGRKRYLPNIRSSNAAARSQAERQAVNTTIQGSAADLVKLAMINIDRRLCEQFPNCWRTHRQKSQDEQEFRSSAFGKRREKQVHGANLVLQLHDELLFEVVEQDFSKVVEIVKEKMESAMKLSVKLPVKMKSGQSWGGMIPIE